MEIIYQIEAELYDLDGILPGGKDFITRYAAHRVGPTTYAFVDEYTLTEAMSLLARYNLKAEKFYVFKLRPEELETYPAVYMGISVIDNLLIDNKINENQLNQAEIAVDYQSERIAVTPRVKKLLERLAKGLQWEVTQGTHGKELILMKVTEKLPEPIFVPSPLYVELNEYPAGTYAVRSDGRDVITEANILKLMEVGVSVSYSVKTQSNVLRWRPRLIATGAVIHALQSANVKGLLETISPLIQESHSLAHLEKNRQGNWKLTESNNTY